MGDPVSPTHHDSQPRNKALKGPVVAMVRLSFKDSIRNKWLILYAVIFFLLAVNVPEVTLVVFGAAPVSYVSSYLTLLVSMSFPYLPLLALPLVSTNIVEERESGILPYMLSNPVSRSEFLAGRLIGLIAATTSVVIIGYGIAAFAAYSYNVADYDVIGKLIGIGVLLNVCVVSVGFFISIAAKRKIAALSSAIFLWFAMAIFANIASTGIVISILRGPIYILPIVLLNPVEAASVLGIYQLQGLNNDQLGIALGVGTLLGVNFQAILLFSMVIWSSVFVVLSFLLFRRQDFP